jgi:DNA mismatch repair protein MutL
MIQQKPFFVLFLEINPNTIDINVHPKKKFIKMQNQILFISELKKELTKVLDSYLGREAAQPLSSLKDFAKQESFSSLSASPKNNNFKPINSFSSFTNNTQTFFETTDEYLKEDIYLFEHKIKKVLGQIHNMFILCETENGMILVDQHAADERINLEKNRVLYSNSFKKQNLISEKLLDLTESQIEILNNNKRVINNLGFEFYNKNENYYLTAVPLFLNKYFDENIFSNILSDLERNENNINKLKDNIIKLKSCKQSIKANTELTIPEQKSILRKLNECKDKGICAHGRPTIIYLSVNDLEKLFKRIV